MIYYLKNIDIEGPGTLGLFFQENGFSSKTVELYNNDPLPKDFDNMEAVVILGGPMNVYEEDRFPYLKAETDFIAQLIKRDILTIGLCLGSQLIARAAGAKVYKAPLEEIGVYEIHLTEEGKKDPLFEEVDEKNIFFQWHGDTFDVPGSGKLLGRGVSCPNQIFKLGTKVYGFQCHMEITQQDALGWIDRYVSDPAQNNKLKQRLIEEFELNQENLCHIAKKTYNNLLKLIRL